MGGFIKYPYPIPGALFHRERGVSIDWNSGYGRDSGWGFRSELPAWEYNFANHPQIKN